MPPVAPTALAAPQVLSVLGNLTGVPVVQAISGTAAVILEAANARVLVLGLVNEAHAAHDPQGARFNRSECVRVAQMVKSALEVLQTELPSSEELPIEIDNALETLHE